MRARQHRSAGFTLVELVIAMTIMTILLGGMASAVLMASHALPDEDDLAERKAAAVEAVNRISRDLMLATTVSRADPNGVKFTVPDRGHGGAGPETLVYKWSGTPGDPLEYKYNGCDDIELCEDVHVFSLEYIQKAKPLTKAPRVLLVVDDAVALGGQGEQQGEPDADRRAAMESWGQTVTLISASATDADFDNAVTTSDVAYVSETVLSSTLGTKLRDAGIGVVNEEGQLCDEFGISSDSYIAADDSIDIIDNTHEITSVFAAGALAICSSTQQLPRTSGTLAGGAQVLAEQPFSSNGLLVVIGAGGALYDGGTAAGRRAKLPWGNSGGFDFDSLTSDGLTLMRRSIVWAAAPIGIGTVKITLQLGSDPGGRVETQVQLLNVPEAP